MIENQEVQLIKQFIRGCWNESLIMQLRLRDYLDFTHVSKMAYSELLYQVRLYEEEKEMKEQRKCKQLGRPLYKSSSSCHIMESESPKNAVAVKSQKMEDRLEHLEGAVSKLMNRPVTQRQIDGTNPKIKSPAPDKSWLSKPWFFCYNCGMEDHSRTECTEVRNAELVQDKLISRQSHVTRSPKAAGDCKVDAKFQRTKYKDMKVNTVLNELVGEPCHTQMFIEGVPCKCLIDTGSQVTCITSGFYKEYLSHIDLHPIEEALQIIGVGGQDVPYLGYLTVSVSFPEQNCGTEKNHVVFALVCPDQNPPTEVPVIVGTNILWKFKENCEQMAGPHFLKKLRINKVWAKIYAVCKVQEKNAQRYSKKNHKSFSKPASNNTPW